MDRDLYFISLIANALDQADQMESLEDAFAEIRRLGRTPPFQRGFVQFCQFMRTAEERIKGADLVLERNGRQVAVLNIDRLPGRAIVQGLLPGQYRVRLGTGWMLWEGGLTEQDLLWSAAFPGKALELAADTQGLPHRPTRMIDLLDGEVILRVYPGLERGSLGIEIGGVGPS